MRGVEDMILTNKPAWPAIRTYFTSATLDAGMTSQLHAGQVIPTPYLDRKYTPDWHWQPPAELGPGVVQE